MKVRMKSGDRRAAIVRSAIHLFAEKGFRGTTTRALAAALGVSEPVLYQHFPTKRDLYSAIIEAEAGELTTPAAELRKLANIATAQEFFGALGDRILRRYETDPELSRLLLFSCLERHDLAEMFFDRLFASFHKLAASYLRRRIKEGEFRRVNPETAARGLIGMISYHGQVSLLFPGRFGKPNRQRIVAEMVEIFLHGIQTSARRTRA